MKYFLYCRKSTESEERQVLSLQSQRDAVDRAFLDKPDIEIVDVFEESKSAKTPGRPIFAAMLARIDAGEAEGIMSWAPDRLARNSIDGGRIIYLLDTGALRDLKFATYTFENNSQGKFMLSIMFGQSKYYSDALSENVKRGNSSKIERGWRPNQVPLGYLNDAATKTIIPDPALFTLIRRMFDMVLYEGKNPHEVAHIAKAEWGVLTPKRARSGGAPISRSAVYKMLRNPFYMGVFEWGGMMYEGRHKPVISRDEYEKVSARLAQRSVPRPRSKGFVFTGLIRCGACNRMVTAERKTKPGGRTYIYYHCTSRGVLRGNCREPSLEEGGVFEAFRVFLSRLEIDDTVAAWTRAELIRMGGSAKQLRADEERARQAALDDISSQCAELMSLRLRKLVSDTEFAELQNQLRARRNAIENAPPAPEPLDMIEPLERLISASKYTADWFSEGSDSEKRTIIKIVGSNPILKGKKLCIQAAEPFYLSPIFEPRPRLLGVVYPALKSVTARTRASRPRPLTESQIRYRGRKLIKSLKQTHDTAEGRERLEKLKQLMGELRSCPSSP